MAKFAFNATPTINARRSSFDMSHTVSTSLPMGKLVPIDAVEVYPGDTWKMRDTEVVRLTSQFIKPIFGNLTLDVYYFYVPSRLVFDKWGGIFGENYSGYYAQQTPVAAPTTNIGTLQSVTSGTVADYIGIPPNAMVNGSNATAISCIPFRSFALIWNEWFRDENRQAPVNIHKGVHNSSEYFNNNAWSVNNYFGQLPPVNKYHDYFTSALQEPQKGEAVTPLGFVDIKSAETLHFMGIGNNVDPRATAIRLSSVSDAFTQIDPRPDTYQGISFSPYAVDDNYKQALIGASISSGVQGIESYPINMSNLVADLSDLDVNDLRTAFALQRVLELMNVGGTRYTEYLSTFFSVTSPDARLQRPEYLGGHRIPINVQQVANTNGSTAGSLGDLGAYSLSNGQGGFSKGFVEHGWLFTVACIRQEHIYSQGISKSLTRSKQSDFYNPVLAHLGEQPIFNYEIYAQHPATSDDDKIFGYQEAWADLRHLPNRVSGYVRPKENGSLESLAIYNIADNYDSLPVLNSDFIEETDIYLNDRISVETDIQHPFVVDIGFQGTAIRNMPVRSYPKLVG